MADELPDKFEIELSKYHIARAKAAMANNSCALFDCPFAVAGKELFPNRYISVGTISMKVDNVSYLADEAAREAIYAFDIKMPMPVGKYLFTRLLNPI